MYLFLKERGLDISNETFKSNLFEDPMAWGYHTIEECIDDPDDYHPWIKELLNISENINESLIIDYIKSCLLIEKKSKKIKYPKQYKAKGKRRKKLDRATKLAKSKNPADRAVAYRLRDNMEKAERRKKGWKNKPRKDTKK